MTEQKEKCKNCYLLRYVSSLSATVAIYACKKCGLKWIASMDEPQKEE